MGNPDLIKEFTTGGLFTKIKENLPVNNRRIINKEKK